MRRLLIALALCATFPAFAQEPSPPEKRLLTDYNGMTSALAAAGSLNPHVNDSLNAYIEQAVKDRAELRYWREYVAGLPKPEAK